MTEAPRRPPPTDPLRAGLLSLSIDHAASVIEPQSPSAAPALPVAYRQTAESPWANPLAVLLRISREESDTRRAVAHAHCLWAIWKENQARFVVNDAGNDAVRR